MADRTPQPSSVIRGYETELLDRTLRDRAAMRTPRPRRLRSTVMSAFRSLSRRLNWIGPRPGNIWDDLGVRPPRR